METLVGDDSHELFAAIERWGSPLNVIVPQPLLANIASLENVANEFDLDFRVYFARKANKCLTLVDTASAAEAGIDVASLAECEQVIERQVSSDAIICTAAIKTRELIELCIKNSITLAIDNQDELDLISQVAARLEKEALVALRVSGFNHQGVKLDSRFGVDVDNAVPFVGQEAFSSPQSLLRLIGLHFHLDGYSAHERISAIQQSLKLVDAIRALRHPIDFLDIGGGIPMSYLESESQWDQFWESLHNSLLERTAPITYRNHSLGKAVFDGQVHGRANVYPYFQKLCRGEWLKSILEATANSNATVAEGIRQRSLQLRCEPGRSILDGCGATIARVAFTKRHPSGDWLIGLEMNHTQVRTGSDDFLVDPLVVQNAAMRRDGEQMEGYLVGAYCTESELLTLRRLRFPQGISAGDLIVFPNTAGYLMHFLESRSHQFPLAKNVIFQQENSTRFEVDPIDVVPST